MKLFSLLIISLHIILNPVAAAARSGAMEPLEFTCATGCLPSTEEDWRRVCGGMVGPKPKSASLSSGAIHRSLSHAEREAVTGESSESKIYKFMTPAKSQGRIGSCTTFAIAACIEYLVSGLIVSEAELYLRIKLLGKLGRDNGGTSLHSYVTLLREGVIRAEDFIPYDEYSDYVKEREALAKKRILLESEVVAVSEDFRTSVEDILRDRDLPRSALVRPVWRVKPFHVRYRGIVECEVREGYWRERKFNCFPLKTHPMNDDILAYFKHVLNSVPIVVSVATFITNDESYYEEESVAQREKREKFYYEDDRGTPLCIDDVWGITPKGRKRLQERGYIIDIPRGTPRIFLDEEIKARNEEIKLAIQTRSKKPLTKDNGWHALCFCGYDNTRKAFKIKNSWGPVWADNGFAWLSYDYVKKYIGSAMVILTHPTDMFIDEDAKGRVRSANDEREYDRVATSTFDAMLAAYNERNARR